MKNKLTKHELKKQISNKENWKIIFNPMSDSSPPYLIICTLKGFNPIYLRLDKTLFCIIPFENELNIKSGIVDNEKFYFQSKELAESTLDEKLQELKFPPIFSSNDFPKLWT